MAKKLRLGLLIDQLDTVYSSKIYRAAAGHVRELGHDLLILTAGSFNYPHDHSYQKELIRCFINPRNLDGLLFASGTQSAHSAPEEVERMIQNTTRGLPVVCVGPRVGRYPGVVADNKSGIRQMIRHLHEVHGVRKFAFMGGPETNQEAIWRKEEFLATLAALGLETSADRMLSGGFSNFGTRAAWEAFFEQGRSLDFQALVCANDEMAITSNQILTQRGIMIPGDLLITGFDDIAQAELDLPPLTTVAQPLEKQAICAMDLLVRQILGESIPELTLLETTPVIRASCGCFSRSAADPAPASQIARAASGNDSPAGLQVQSGQGKKSTAAPDFLEASLSHFFPELGQNRIRGLMEGLFNLAGDSSGEFRPEIWTMELYQILSWQVRGSQDIRPWDQILTMLRRAVHERARDSGNTAGVEKAFHDARIMVTDMTRVSYGQKLTTLQGRLHRLRDNLEHLIFVIDLDGMVDKIEEELKNMGMEYFQLVLWNPDFSFHRGDESRLPELGRILMARGHMEENDPASPPRAFGDKAALHEHRLGSVPLLLPPDHYPEEPWTLVASALYFQDRQLGYLVYSLGDDDPFIYETLNVLIANTLQVSMLFSARQEAEKRLTSAMTELENYNQKLAELSQTDELTSIYNRRGFLSLGTQTWKLGCRMKKPMLLFFADVDGLKQINDRLGHKAGDEVIKACASVLKSTFRGMDIPGRLGGDEFVILTVDTPLELGEVIHQRLLEGIAAWNRGSNQAFELSLSLGWVAVGDEKDFETYLARADEALYEEKRQKKARGYQVIRQTAANPDPVT